MKRRNFLQTGTLSMLSIGLPAGAVSLAWKPQPSVQNWLRQLVEAVDARRQTNNAGWPQQLRDQVATTEAFLAGRGFFRESNGMFFCAGGNTCFYPLVLRRASANLTEFLVPVLNRQSDGSWKQLAVLTGYQMEALSRAAASLSEQQKPLHELLLPAGGVSAVGSVFSTLRGTVSMKTILQNGSAHTEVCVMEGKHILFSEHYRSQHTLSSTPNRDV